MTKRRMGGMGTAIKGKGVSGHMLGMSGMSHRVVVGFPSVASGLASNCFEVGSRTKNM